MFNRSIFRSNAIRKMTSPEELDELLQVNPVRMWFFLIALFFVIAGLMLWLFASTITQQVYGFGELKTDEMPREILSDQSGQVDSVFCRTGDLVQSGQKLACIYGLDDKKSEYLRAPFSGHVSGVWVKESDFVKSGETMLEMVIEHAEISLVPEAVFFVTERDVSRIKPGMVAIFKINIEEIPTEYLSGPITFLSDYPVSANIVQRYYHDPSGNELPKAVVYYEARALLPAATAKPGSEAYRIIRSLNGLHCEVSVVIARKSPFSFFINMSR